MGRTLFNRKIIDLKMRRIELNYLQANSCLCYHQLRCFCTMSYKWDGLWFVVMVNFRLPKPFSPHSKGTRIPESRKCLLVESGIPPTIRIRSLSPLTKNPESTVWNLESKTVLDSSTWGDPYNLSKNYSQSCVFRSLGCMRSRRWRSGLRASAFIDKCT